MLRRRVERKRIDADLGVAKSDFQIAAQQKGREFR